VHSAPFYIRILRRNRPMPTRTNTCFYFRSVHKCRAYLSNIVFSRSTDAERVVCVYFSFRLRRRDVTRCFRIPQTSAALVCNYLAKRVEKRKRRNRWARVVPGQLRPSHQRRTMTIVVPRVTPSNSRLDPHGTVRRRFTQNVTNPPSLRI